MRCWGINESGQLGYGNTTPIGDNETPGSVGTVDLGAGRTAVSVGVGYRHSCAILDNGTVRCWGANESGQLGYGNTTPIGDNETPGSVGTVDLGAGAVAISVGSLHTCAVLSDGTVRCWGLGTSGQLGYGNTQLIGDNETPAAAGAVNLGAGRTAVAISLGDFHSCALLDNGTVRCWGRNKYGQLGYGHTNDVGDNETPGDLGTVDMGDGLNARAIAAGEDQTCAVLGNGAVRCWGINESGQLGYGNTKDIGDDESPGSVGPVELGATLAATAVAAGANHTCAILSDGTVRCWGSGANGRLGYGNTDTIGDNETPASVGSVGLGAGRTAVQLALGSGHTCALLDNGTVRCWGAAGNGQLGYGNTNTIGDNETPATAGPVDLGGRSAVQIATGSEHTCAVLDNGTVRCWGNNTYGQLGYGNTNTIGDNETPGSVTPLDLGAGRTAVALAAGANHTCALLDNGTVQCWGQGAFGQLGGADQDNIGDDESPAQKGPVNLGAGLRAVEIAAGLFDTCARLNNGAVRCWGANNRGQLGYGNTNNIGDNETPATAGPVDLGGANAMQVAAGSEHTCALLVSHAVRCWGWGFEGVLGNANTANIGDDELPSSIGPVNVGRSALAVSGGSAHTCALLDNGTVRCWGYNASGQLGYGNTQSIGDNETPNTAGPVDFVDDSPVAVSDSATLAEDSSATAVNVLANDTDVDGGPKEVASKTNGAHGTVSITGGGSGLTYAPEANYCGSDSFTYTLNGGSIGTVSVTVSCVDDAPVAVSDSATIAEDSTATAIGVLVNDTDIDGGPKTIASKTNGTHGAVAITGGGSGLTYAPEANYCGSDSFTYTLNGGSIGTVSVTVSCVDDAPVAVSDSATLAEDSSATAINVLANDTDVDGGPKEVASKTNGAHGTVSITGGGSGVTYTPDTNYCGPDSFTYMMNGGSTGTVSVTVSCVDDPPAAVNDSATVAEDSGANAIDVLANDTDIDGGAKEVASKTNGAHGTVSITGGGSGLTYTPEANYCGPDFFSYELTPGGSKATVAVTVSCVDNPPVAVNDSTTLAEDSSATPIDVLANDTDVDGGLKAVESKTNGLHGTATITGGGTGLAYSPGTDYCGPDSFTYTLNGGSTGTVSVTVSCVDDAPVAVDDSDTLQEDVGATAIDVLANDTDVDGGLKSIAGRTNGAHGSVAIIGGGAGLTYAPAADYCGPDAFTYTLDGGSTATVSVTVSCVDEPAPPQPAPQTPTQAPTQGGTAPSSSGSVVSITPGVGVVSGRRRPRVAVKGVYAFFTLTCKLTDRDCAGTVTITINVPSIALGPTMRNVRVIKGRFRIGSRRSVLVRAKLTRAGLEVLEKKRSLRGVSAHMGIVDTGNGERGRIQVNLVRRPKASLLPTPRSRRP